MVVIDHPVLGCFLVALDGGAARRSHGGAEGVGSAMVDLALDRSSLRVGQLDGHD